MIIKSFVIYGSLAVISVALLTLYIIGAARYLTDHEENTCKMTYMFEYPKFVRIALESEVENSYPRYTLYAYGEGFVIESIRKMHFTGLPVLFIPGHAGSHEQVRSIASVSLRKSLKDRTPFHFDYFAVSFGKDYNGFYGGVLAGETAYVSHCIRKILSLYKGNIDNIVLIGHSMGGIIAKETLVLNSSINVSAVSMIINLATPTIPSLVLDNTFANYYRKLQSYESKIKDAGTSIVSIGGGARDVIVSSAQIIDPSADINVLSTSIPDVWMSNDHLSILWCKELVLSIVRALFDSVDLSKRPPRIYRNPVEKIKALTYHFQNRAAGKKLYDYPEKIDFETNGEWIEDIRRQYVWDSRLRKSNRRSFIYLMIRLKDHPNHLTVDTFNLEVKDWIFACTALRIQGQSRVCESGWNLSNFTQLTPDYLRRSRRTIDLDLNELKHPEATHIVIRISPDDLDDRVIVKVDRYYRDRRSFHLRNGFSLLNGLFDSKRSTSLKIVRGEIRYYVALNDIKNVVKIEFKDTECIDAKEAPHSVVELFEPWYPGVTQIKLFTEEDNGPKTIKLQTTYGHPNTTAYLRVTIDPSCTHTINIQTGDVIDQMSCIIRDRWPILYMIFVGLLLLTMSIQIDSSADKIPILIITIILSFYFGIVLETCIALTILCIFAIGTCCSVIFLGSVAHNIAVRFLARVIAFSTTWSDWLLGGLNQFPFVTTILVMSLIPATCGALAMFITLFLQFLKLTNTYEDYLEELLMASLQHFNWTRHLRRTRDENSESSESSRQKILDQLLLFMLWCFAALPAIPSVLTWARNFSYETKLSTEDPVLLLSWFLLVFLGTSDIIKISSCNGKTSAIMGHALYFTGWVVLSMAASSQPSFYQCYMPPIVGVVTTFIAINSLLPY